jgi:hypothetical protein
MSEIVATTETSEKEPRTIWRLVGGLLLVVVLALLARRFLPDLLNTPSVVEEPTLLVPVVTVKSLRGIAELATVEYTAIAEVRNERIPDDIRRRLGAREQILMLVYGEVKAGFDLSKLSEEDLWTDGTRVQLHLPAPETLSVSIDFDNTHIVHYEKSVLMSADPTLEGEALQAAQVALGQAAVEGGVLELAKQYGVLFFENHLRSLGFTEIRIAVN